jgi:thiopeptide-type bacteriocin biosynthesis protein
MPMTADDATERAVLAVLAGTPPTEVATQSGIDPTTLGQAVHLYQAAGHAALQQHAIQGLGQLQIHLPDQKTAEQTVATRLGPHLRQAEAAGLISSWWFVRKLQWRLRYEQGTNAPNGDARRYLSRMLDQLRAEGTITGWCDGIYEPEIHAFGGPHAMAVAHDLFHHDSRHILGYLAQPQATAGRRELSIMLCNLLTRAAGQDWYERGDIWARVVEHRPHDPQTPPEHLDRIKPQLHRLMTVDFGPNSDSVRLSLGQSVRAGRKGTRRSGPRRPPHPWPTRYRRPPHPVPLEPPGHHHSQPGNPRIGGTRGCSRHLTGKRRPLRRAAWWVTRRTTGGCA